MSIKPTLLDSISSFPEHSLDYAQFQLPTDTVLFVSPPSSPVINVMEAVTESTGVTYQLYGSQEEAYDAYVGKYV